MSEIYAVQWNKFDPNPLYDFINWHGTAFDQSRRLIITMENSFYCDYSCHIAFNNGYTIEVNDGDYILSIDGMLTRMSQKDFEEKYEKLKSTKFTYVEKKEDIPEPIDESEEEKIPVGWIEVPFTASPEDHSRKLIRTEAIISITEKIDGVEIETIKSSFLTFIPNITYDEVISHLKNAIKGGNSN